jgi:hypothetical protein
VPPEELFVPENLPRFLKSEAELLRCCAKIQPNCAIPRNCCLRNMASASKKLAETTGVITGTARAEHRFASGAQASQIKGIVEVG